MHEKMIYYYVYAYQQRVIYQGKNITTKYLEKNCNYKQPIQELYTLT